jgi:paraquat-inducible protein B
MKTRRGTQIKIGAFVVGGVVILVAAVLLIGSGQLFKRTHPMVSYFDGSVNGLRPGASVKFKGVEVGRVDQVRIAFGVARTDQPIAVLYSLDGDQLEAVGGGSGSWRSLVESAIEDGLRAQLESDSLLTGVQHVSLSFQPGTETRFHDPVDDHVEIPTIPPPLQEVGAALRAIVDRIGRYDFEKLFDSLRTALDAAGELARAPEIRASLASFDKTMKEAQETLATVRANVDPLAKKLDALVTRADAIGSDVQSGIVGARATMDSVRKAADNVSAGVVPLTDSLKQASDRLQALAQEIETTLASTRVLLDPEAPIAVELRAGLRELSETARATRKLFELLERTPSALVRGRGEQEEGPR